MTTIILFVILAILVFVAWKGYFDCTWKQIAASTVFFPISIAFIAMIIPADNYPSGFLAVLLLFGPTVIFAVLAISQGDSRPSSSHKSASSSPSTKSTNSNSGTITLNTSFFRSPYSVSNWNQAFFSNGTVYAKGVRESYIIGYYSGTSIFEEDHDLCGFISPASSPGEKHYIFLTQEYIYNNYKRMLLEHPDTFRGYTLRQPDSLLVAHFYINGSTIWDNKTDEAIATFTGDAYGAAASLVCAIQSGDIKPYDDFYGNYGKNILVRKQLQN